jgi:mRNA interferase RelE/StbE
MKRIEKLDPQSRTSIKKKITLYVYPQIKLEPFFGKNIKKLKDYVPDTWRYRIGKFRIFYTADQDEKIIYILTIDHRKDAYR